ncbi:hypothetical protein PAMP_017112 [Pampus punctatissimus]
MEPQHKERKAGRKQEESERLCTGFESSFSGEEGFCCHRQSCYQLLARCDIVT